ncbi:Mitochondrial inner membrane i-AAA protease supercomplex subunit YME1 [Exophiala dermatitidis]
MALQAPLSQLPVRMPHPPLKQYLLMPISMQSLSILGPDLWTALPSLVTSSLKTLRRNRVARLKAEPDAQPTQHKQTTTERSINNPSGSPAMRLPDFLASVPIESLRSAPLHVRQHQTLPWLSGNLRTAMAPNSFIFPTSRSYTTRAPPLPTLRVAARMGRVKAPRFQSPMLSTSSILFGRPGTGHTTGLKNHYRQFSSTFQPQNQNMLAHMERTANNNPTSATAQNAFYSALLRANMPKLVIERYQSGRYASNAATDATYLKALQMVGSVPAPGTPNYAASSPQGGALPPETLQAVGQAVAGQNYGGSLVMPSNKSGTGAREAPLYVVVEESWGNTILKWVKTFLWVGLAGYFLLVILTMVVEMSGSLRTRVGQNNEVQPQHQTVRFSDVHGCDEAKEELQELVEFLKNPEKFNKLGGKLPKGVLLVGPPGTGKTMLARAVAGEAGVPVFYMSGSEFDELYVGVGAKRVRDLFAQARNKAPAIIFIDELDAVGGKRNARDPAYAKQTLNQLLTELDGFSPSTGVILIAATNYPESLDKALTRPGRFDRHINVPLPDVRGRIEILKHHMRNMPVAADVDATVLARATSGMSGADLENLCNQAAVHASRLKCKKVNAQNFEWAKDKIMMGAEVKSRMIREKDKIQTAYHEAGHALPSQILSRFFWSTEDSYAPYQGLLEAYFTQHTEHPAL